MKKLFLLCLLLLVFKYQKAQFTPALIEGDYAPAAPLKLSIEDQNKKHKDAPHVYFDNERKLWHATWTQFDVYKSKQKNDFSVIYYSRSDEGKTWTTPKQLNSFNGDCLDGDSTVKGPMPCVGVNGEVYVTWAGPKGLAFQCSLDSGKTWLKEEKIINPLKGGWATKVDEIKTNGLPFIACDNSKGEFRGRIYVTWSDEKNGMKDKDVFLVYSDDKGKSWVDRLLLSYKPNHKEQFKPCMKIDSLTGFIYILYFDKQDHAYGKETDLTLALSKNGGLKFDFYKLNTKPFLFNSNFTELVDNNGIRAGWVQVDASKRFGLYEVLVNDSTINDYNLKYPPSEIDMERTAKFADKINVEFKMKHNSLITAVITKPLDPSFEKIIVKDKRVFEGNNKLTVDTKLAGLKKGNYILTLYYNNRSIFVWITEE